MTLQILAGIVVSAGAAVLQSTVLRFIAIAGVQPDIVIVIIIFVANRNGSMVGQVVGAAAGLTLDLLGLAPLGFYTLIYTVVGSLFGLTHGKVFVDPVFIPLVLTVIAVLVKGALAAIVTALYSIDGVMERLVSAGFLLSLGYSAILGPILFGILGVIRPLMPDPRRSEGRRP